MLDSLDLPASLAPTAQAVDRALALVRGRFDAQLRSDIPAVADLMAHLAAYRGKMLRPTLSILFAMACDQRPLPLIDRVSDEHVAAAAVVEMVHVATLIHDDVLDEADLRRNRPTISHLRGNEAAVILGDFLFAAAYDLCSHIHSPPGPHATAIAVARASMTVCAGELLQLSHRGNLSLSEPEYLDIIDRKTAALVALACELGCINAPAPMKSAASNFGTLLGRAFQIQDDLLDLAGDQRAVGKSIGRDLDLGKMTLPLIRHLASLDTRARHETESLIRLAASHDNAAATNLRKRLLADGSIASARQEAIALTERARAALTVLPDSPPRQALELMAHAAVRRDH